MVQARPDAVVPNQGPLVPWTAGLVGEEAEEEELVKQVATSPHPWPPPTPPPSPRCRRRPLPCPRFPPPPSPCHHCPPPPLLPLFAPWNSATLHTCTDVATEKNGYARMHSYVQGYSHTEHLVQPSVSNLVCYLSHLVVFLSKNLHVVTSPQPARQNRHATKLIVMVGARAGS